MADQFGGSRKLPFRPDDDGRDPLAPLGVRQADDRALPNAGMLAQRLLDLRRIHVLASGDDHVLDPVDDVELALCVTEAGIAGPIPAVFHDRRRCFRLLPVAAEHRRRSDQELADRALRHFQPIGVDDTDLDQWQRRSAGAQRGFVVDIMLLGPQQGQHARGFGGAVELHEAALHLQQRTFQQGRGNRRAGVHHQTQ